MKLITLCFVLLFATTQQLPIKDLRVTRDNTLVLVHWQSVGKEIFDHYEMEVSNDGKRFTLNSIIPAIVDNNEQRIYESPVLKPGTGKFVRLKLVDKEGGVSFTNHLVIPQ